MICGGDEYICKVIMCSTITRFQIFWKMLKIITMVVIEDGRGDIQGHDVTVSLLYFYQKHCCQHITTCIIAAIKWVNGMR